MSEQSQGPGWWKASDGKWYPPEQAPAAPPPSTAPIAAPPPAGAPVGPPLGPPGAPPPGAPPGDVPPYVPPTPGSSSPSNNTAKIVAVIVALALVAGGVAFAMTRGSGSSGGSTDAFCAQAKKIVNDPSFDRAGNDPAELDRIASAVDQLQKSAPKEIQPDAAVFDQFVKALIPKLKAAVSDPDKTIKALDDTSNTVGAQRLQTAEQNLQRFGLEKCGVDLKLASESS